MDETTDSFWLVFSNDNGDTFVLGMNAYGAYRLMLIDGSNYQNMKSEDLKLHMFYCYRDIDQKHGYYYDECLVDVPANLLPPDITHFQYVHAHQTKGDSFFGTVCPGQSGDPNPMMPEVDWRGCRFDVRTVLDQKYNQEYSQLWNEFLNSSENRTSIGRNISLSVFLLSVVLSILNLPS